ncbi:MAG: hypothetical protein ACE5I1_17125 [bacterium]
MKRVILLLVLGILVMGCAGSSNMATTENRMRTIAVDYQDMFKATEDYIKERGFRILKMDEAKGVIESHYREGVGWGEGFTGDKRAKVIAKVKKIDASKTQVVVELISEVRDQYSGWQPVEMTVGQEQIYYTRFLEGICARAEGRSIK